MRRIRNRLAGIALSLCAAAAILFGSCAREEVVKVAYIGSLSGRLADNSIVGRNALELYLSRFSGEKRRFRLQLVQFDDKSDPENISELARSVVAQGIRLVIGPLSSSDTLRTREVFESENVLQIGPIASVDNLAGLDDNFIKMYPSVRSAADYLAKRAAEQNLASLVPIMDLANETYGGLWLDSFRENLAGTTLVSEPVTYRSPGNTDFARIVGEALTLDPAGILLVTNAVDGSAICQLLRAQRPLLPLFVSSWAFSEAFLEGTGKSSEGALFSAAFDYESDDPAYRSFLAQYESKYPSPVNNFVAVYCFDSIRLLDEALQSAASPDPGDVKRAILRIKTFRGLQQSFSVNEYGDALRDFRLVTVRNGAFRTFE